jgi:hypothetical protein
MKNTSYSLGPLWTAIKEEHRRVRAARAARRSLEGELASYTSPTDLADMNAILDRYSEEQTADIRDILATRS